ncbi:MAG: hypothetical protein J2P41_12015 [Blastocatellia bacterium]|nr:hypothetical protein [Blastocatellia bacterium]
MSKSSNRKRRYANTLQSKTKTQQTNDETRPGNKPARLAIPDRRNLLDRLLNTPQLAQVVPRLQPELLHRVIQSCGLEDCGEILALATPEQLAHVFDLDLWRSAQPGKDEQFDADRFGVWLEVLAESGAAVAASMLAEMDVDLVIAGLAQHAFVYDNAAVSSYETTSGDVVDYSHIVADGITSEVGGYVLAARRDDSWEAIVAVLSSLDADHPDYFHRVMQGCRDLSNSKPEIDGLDNLLTGGDQDMFDLAADREGRREKRGYVAPAQARAFLRLSRELRLESDAMPLSNPIARAYFRALDKATATDARSASGLLAAGPETKPNITDDPEASTDGVAAIYELLVEAGILAQPPRALLGGSGAPRLARIQQHMQFLLDNDRDAYSAREEELAFLANTLMAGCSLQARPFTAPEASDAVMAVCNLGLENWPPHWLQAKATSDSFLVELDLVSVFQVGWRILYIEVVMHAAKRLIEVLSRLRCADRETEAGLDALRSVMAKQWRAGTPWRARDALDVIAILDMPAWLALLTLIDECPAIHGCLSATLDSRRLSVSESDFEFISENSQIAPVHEFMRRLPDILRS